MFPKNLSQLKKDADKFVFTMTQHSYSEPLAVFGNLGRTALLTNKLIGIPRKVVVKQANAIAFEPTEPGRGPSYLRFDSGAKGFKFEGNKVIVDLDDEPRGEFNLTMTYELTPIEDKP